MSEQRNRLLDELFRLVQTDNPTEKILSLDVPLPGKSWHTLTIRTEFTDEEQNYYNIRTAYPCIGMEATIQFSSDLKVEGLVSHPGPADLKHFVVRPNNEVHAVIRATLMPLQGIFLNWRKADP